MVEGKGEISTLRKLRLSPCPAVLRDVAADTSAAFKVFLMKQDGDGRAPIWAAVTGLTPHA